MQRNTTGSRKRKQCDEDNDYQHQDTVEDSERLREELLLGREYLVCHRNKVDMVRDHLRTHRSLKDYVIKEEENVSKSL